MYLIICVAYIKCLRPLQEFMIFFLSTCRGQFFVREWFLYPMVIIWPKYVGVTPPPPPRQNKKHPGSASGYVNLSKLSKACYMRYGSVLLELLRDSSFGMKTWLIVPHKIEYSTGWITRPHMICGMCGKTAEHFGGLCWCLLLRIKKLKWHVRWSQGRRPWVGRCGFPPFSFTRQSNARFPESSRQRVV